MVLTTKQNLSLTYSRNKQTTKYNIINYYLAIMLNTFKCVKSFTRCFWGESSRRRKIKLSGTVMKQVTFELAHEEMRLHGCSQNAFSYAVSSASLFLHPKERKERFFFHDNRAQLRIQFRDLN